ncbi:iron-containing alcohol dehydrogenase [Mucilaginibacter sp. PAMB04274]|uniref:iron-containing alcohol dehydrogenase n=1 Tax=Mucilaginibacter sp. PAMB04274 TaxID=3138568 RepID=UPI0031F63871
MIQHQLLKIHFPGKLIFGNGSLDGLADEVLQLNAKEVLIITITPLLDKLSQLINQLQEKGITVNTDTSITQEPSFADFRTLMQSIAQQNFDVVLGIGGGSVLDVAKLVAAQKSNTQTLEEIVGNGLLKGRTTGLICVPATSGTGSEVSPNAILVDDEHQKKGIISPYLVPDIVYVDPLLTISVPAAITAATGLDALTHCLEAYTNKFAQPFIDMYAFEGMRLIAQHLVTAVNNGADEEARSHVAMGSMLGGFCLGPVNTAAVHALSYPLGSTFNLPHGLSNALLLPYVMEFNAPAAPKRYADVAVALGCERQADDAATAQAGVKKIRELIAACGIEATLTEVGITADAIPQMATKAMLITRLLNNNPRPVTYDDAVAIYTAALG